MKVWVCGRVIQSTPLGQIWDLMGVFSDEEKAMKACVRDNYFIGPTDLDQHLPEAPQVWPGAYYPLAEKPQEENHGTAK